MTIVWLLPSSILNKTPTKLRQKIGYQSGSLWTICLQVCMQTINETMDYFICMKFENMPDFHLHVIHKIENVVKIKNENVCFWSRPVIQVGPWCSSRRDLYK